MDEGRHLFKEITKEEFAQVRIRLEKSDRQARSKDFVGQNAFQSDHREYSGQVYCAFIDKGSKLIRTCLLSALNVNTSHIVLCKLIGVSCAPMNRSGLGKDVDDRDSRMLCELKSKLIGRFLATAIEYYAKKFDVAKDELTFVFIETNFFPTMCMLDQRTYPHGIRAVDVNAHKIPVHNIPGFNWSQNWGVWNSGELKSFKAKRVKALAELARDLGLSLMIQSSQIKKVWEQERRHRAGIENAGLLVYFTNHPSDAESGATIKDKNGSSFTMSAFLDAHLDTNSENFAALAVQYPENINRFPNEADREKLVERVDVLCAALHQMGYHGYQIHRAKDCLHSFLNNKPGAMVADDMGLGKSRIFFAVVAFLLVECDLAKIVIVFFLCNMEELKNAFGTELERFGTSEKLKGMNIEWSRASIIAKDRVHFDNHRTNKGFSEETKRALENDENVNTAVIVDEASNCMNSATPLQCDLERLPVRCFRNFYSATPIDGSLRPIFFVMKALNMTFVDAQVEATFLHVCEDILLRGITSSPAIEALRRVIASFTYKSSKADVLRSLPFIEGPKETHCFVKMSRGSVESIRGVLGNDDNDDGDDIKGIVRMIQIFGSEYCESFPEYTEEIMPVASKMHSLMARDAEAARAAGAKKPAHLVIISSSDIAIGRKIQQDLIALNGNDAQSVALICYTTPPWRRRKIFEQLADENDPLRIIVTTGQTGGFGMNAPNIVSCDAIPTWTPSTQIQGEGRGQRHAGDDGMNEYERKLVSRTWIMYGPNGVASLSLTKSLRSVVRKHILQVLFPPATREIAAFHHAALRFWRTCLRNDSESDKIAALHTRFFAELGVDQTGFVELTAVEICDRLSRIIGEEQQPFEYFIPSVLYKLPRQNGNADAVGQAEELDELDDDDDDDDDDIASDHEDEDDEDEDDGDNSTDSDDDGDQHYTADAIMRLSYFGSSRRDRFVRHMREKLADFPEWYGRFDKLRVNFYNATRGLTNEGALQYADALIGRRGISNTTEAVAKNVGSDARNYIQTASGLYSGPRTALRPGDRSRNRNRSYGLAMQGAAISEFTRRIGIAREDVVSMDDVTLVYRDGMGYPVLLTTLDFALPKYDCIVEVKCKRRQHAMICLDLQQEIRNHWGQCQAQMNIVGASKCVLLIYHNGDDPAGRYPDGYSRKMLEFAVIHRDENFFRNNEREWQAYRLSECFKCVLIERHGIFSVMGRIVPDHTVQENFREFVVAIVRANRNPIASALFSPKKRSREEDDREGQIPNDEIFDFDRLKEEAKDIFPQILQKFDRNTLKALHATVGFKDEIVFPPHVIDEYKIEIGHKFRLDDVEKLEMLKMAILWYEWPATNFEEEQKSFLRQVLEGERGRGELEFPMSKYLLREGLFAAHHEDEIAINQGADAEMDEED